MPTAQDAMPGTAGDARRARGEATRRRLLDAAEHLFADRGFKAVTMRDIAAAAGTELSLTTHHFGSKQALAEKVLMRRADEAFGAVLAALDQVEAHGAVSPTMIFGAYVGTFLTAIEREDPGWTSYMKLMLRRADESSQAYAADQPLMLHYRPVRLRYIAALRAAQPGTDYASAAFAMTMLEGALGYALFERSHRAFDDPDKRRRRAALLLRRLALFLAGGFEATGALEGPDSKTTDRLEFEATN
ncbi:MAG: TetR/AcrR family transcriptional regulator [Sphingobium sp.]